MMKWKRFITASGYLGQDAPFYIQWVIWCYRKPIWIGLPLVGLAIPIILIDLIYIIITGLVMWSKHKL